MIHRLALPGLILLSGTVSAGQVRVVGPSPAPYPRIQDAINAAQTGDVILVESSAHDSVRIAGKAVSIVADTGVTIQESGAIRITNLRPKMLVTLSGIHATGTGSGALPELSHGLFADACFGQILVQDCILDGFSGAPSACGPAGAGASLFNSLGVSFTRCTIRGGSLTQVAANPGHQGDGIDSTGPNLISCDDTDVRGGGSGLHCNTSYPGDGAWGGNGATLRAGSLFGSGSGFLGGLGGAAAGAPIGCTPGTFGGGGGNGIQNPLPTNPVTVRVLSTLVNGQVGGISCGGPQGPVGSAYSGLTATTIAGTPRRLVGPRVLRDDQLATFTFTGAPNERVEFAASLGSAIHAFDASRNGVLHVLGQRWSSVGTVPASGALSRSYKLPNLPLTDPGAVFVLQARFVDPVTGAVRLSNAHVLVEVDASY